VEEDGKGGEALRRLRTRCGDIDCRF
jgi:hypothetical protein